MIDFLKNPLTSLLSLGENWSKGQVQWGDTTISFLDEGILQFSPNQVSSDNALLLSCGIHGNETAPIEIVCDLLKEIYAKTLSPTLPLLVQFGNLKAMKTQERFLDFNLNRLFSGTHERYKQSSESKRTVVLEESTLRFMKDNATQSLWHLDLHTAIRGSFHQKFAIRPFRQIESNSILRTITREEVNLLQNLGIQAVVQSHAINTTYSSYSCTHFDALSFTLELGKVKPFGENNRDDFQEVYDGLHQFIATGAPPQESKEREEIVSYEVTEELIRVNKETALHLPDDYHNFKPLIEGSPIQTTNGITRSAKPGEAVIFPNKNVKLGQRTGLIISPIDTL